MQLNEMMDSFMNVYGVERTAITGEDCYGAFQLACDELVEFSDEFITGIKENGTGDVVLFEDDCINKANVVKEMADIIYVTAQRMRRMGMDVDAVMNEVHRSNMSKMVGSDFIDQELELARERYPDAISQLVEDGVHVIRDPNTGKIVKPLCYSAAVITPEMIKAP